MADSTSTSTSTTSTTSTTSSTTLAHMIPMNESERSTINSLLGHHPDFPKPGINFVDVFPLFQYPAHVTTVIDAMKVAATSLGTPLDFIAGIESRGFLFAPLLALALNIPFIPIRKAGKLPGKCATKSYDLEYGSASIQVATYSVKAGQRGIVCDDLLATGGTGAAAISLLQEQGCSVAAVFVMIDLKELKGAQRFSPIPTWTLLSL